MTEDREDDDHDPNVVVIDATSCPMLTSDDTELFMAIQKLLTDADKPIHECLATLCNVAAHGIAQAMTNEARMQMLGSVMVTIGNAANAYAHAIDEERRKESGVVSPDEVEGMTKQ